MDTHKGLVWRVRGKWRTNWKKFEWKKHKKQGDRQRDQQLYPGGLRSDMGLTESEMNQVSEMEMDESEGEIDEWSYASSKGGHQ